MPLGAHIPWSTCSVTHLVILILNLDWQRTSLLQSSNFRSLQHFHWSWNCLYLSRRATELRCPSDLHWDVGVNNGMPSREVKWPSHALGQRGWATRTDSLNHQGHNFTVANKKQILLILLGMMLHDFLELDYHWLCKLLGNIWEKCIIFHYIPTTLKRQILFVLFCLSRIHKPKQDSRSIAVYITITHYPSLPQSVLLFSMYFLFCVITGSDGVFLCQILILSKLIKV